jgi:hypothetical protein
VPECMHPRTSAIEKLPALDWVDSITDDGHALPSVFLGPDSRVPAAAALPAEPGGGLHDVPDPSYLIQSEHPSRFFLSEAGSKYDLNCHIRRCSNLSFFHLS